MTENARHNGVEPFENPDLLPLEELKLKVKTDGVVEVYNALDKRWADERYFLHYEAPAIYNDDGTEIPGAKEHWMEVVGYMIDDLKWLRGLPFYRFWSNVIFNTSILDALVSFLQEAPPFYALENFPNCLEMLELLETVRHHVLVIFARLVTNKESPAEYMNRPFLGNLLYEKYVFTVPIIFDLCQLYGRENAKAVKKILVSLFTLEPLYNDDLQRAVPCLIEAFENVERKFMNHPSDVGAVSLSEGSHGNTEMTLFQLEDMILYVLDISSTLTVLLRNYPPVVRIFHKEHFMNKIVSVYESTIPEMYNRLDKLANTDEGMPKYIELKHRLDVTRVELLQLFRTIIIEPVRTIQQRSNTATEAEIKDVVHEYIAFLNIGTLEKEFITDYNQFYPVKNDLTILSSLCPEVDTIKCEYILQPIYNIIGKPDEPVASVSHNIVNAVAGPSGIQDNQPATSSSSTTDGSKKKEISKDSVEYACLVTKIKDILCDLGEGFIEMCLEYYNYNTESVINAICEDTLPPQLKEIDRTLPHIPPDPMKASAAVDLALGVERLNIFDNDEFDVMTRDVIDKSRVHVGKRRDKYRNMTELLNDKSNIKETSGIYSKYSLVDDYNDEYDDTYDGDDVPATTDTNMEVDSRPFTTPRVLLASKEKSESVSDESDTDEEAGTLEQNGRDQFIQNPAEIRAKLNQKRQAARAGKSFNVVGKPRGQGQDRDILINRDHKNTHKATRANHDRRSGSQWKRRQGMVPS